MKPYFIQVCTDIWSQTYYEMIAVTLTIRILSLGNTESFYMVPFVDFQFLSQMKEFKNILRRKV